MRLLPRRSLCPLAVALVSAIASTVGAQAPRPGQLHVLRFLPEGIAGPADSLVVAFDHPVAPKLDKSVDPAGVVRLDPSVRTTAYWRDPSTIVVRFAEPLAFGARYQVTYASGLRSTDGATLADGQGRELQVRKPQLLLVYPSGGRQTPDPLQRPWAVYEGAVPLDYLSGRFVAVKTGDACRAIARKKAYTRKNQRRAAEKRAEWPKMQCASCGTPVSAQRRTRRYCSVQCRQQAFRDHQRAGRPG